MLTQVIAGMGGIGKTQLAADHANRAWDGQRVDLLVWVAASSRESIISSYARRDSAGHRHGR